MHPLAQYPLLAALCALTAAPALARAQSTAPPSLTLETRAQELYQQGRERFFAGDFEQARGLFQTSLDTVDSPNTRMYLGRALQRLSRNAEAYLMLDRAARDAAARVSTEPRYTPTRDAARAEAEALAPAVGWLLIECPTAPEGLAVRVNGHAVQLAGIGVEMPLDPGEVLVEASARGYADVRASLSLDATAHERVTLRFEALPRPDARASPEAPAVTERPTTTTVLIPTPRSVPLRNFGIATIALGGSALVAAGALRLIAQSDFDALVEQRTHNSFDSALADQGELAQTLSYVLLGVGAGASVAGAVMWYLGARTHLTPLTVSVTPQGLSLGGRF